MLEQKLSDQPDESESEEECLDELPSEVETQKVGTKFSRKIALQDFKDRVEDAIRDDYIFGPIENGPIKESLKGITLWGVPLLPSKGHEGTDIVLSKFLEANRYNVSEAFKMIRRTMKWRREFKVDNVLDEKFSPELESMWCTSGTDKEGRPLCYHTFKEFKDNDLRRKFLRADEKLGEFLRWRIQCIEKEIRMLNFSPGGANSVVHIVDMKGTRRPGIKRLPWICKKMATLVFANYPGIVQKTFAVNVPLWFFAIQALHPRQMVPRSPKQTVFLRSSIVTKTLLKYITPENLLVEQGGLRRMNDSEFSVEDKVLELNMRANAVEQIQLPVNEVERIVSWDVTIIGSEVTFKEEFIPNDDCSYKVLLNAEKNMGNGIRNSFYIREPGSIVITIGNGTFKRKKVFYRYKSKPCEPLYLSTCKK